jgi:hypothetical protein
MNPMQGERRGWAQLSRLLKRIGSIVLVGKHDLTALVSAHSGGFDWRNSDTPANVQCISATGKEGRG